MKVFALERDSIDGFLLLTETRSYATEIKAAKQQVALCFDSVDTMKNLQLLESWYERFESDNISDNTSVSLGAEDPAGRFDVQTSDIIRICTAKLRSYRFSLVLAEKTQDQRVSMIAQRANQIITDIRDSLDKELSETAGFPSVDIVECLEVLTSALLAHPGVGSSDDAADLLARNAFPLLFRHQVLSGRYRDAVSTLKRSNEFARPPETSQLMIEFTKRRVASVKFKGGGGYSIVFSDESKLDIPSGRNLTKEYPIERIVFAVLANPAYQGSEITYGFVREHLEAEGVTGFEVAKVTEREILFTISKRTGEQETVGLKRCPEKIVPKPTHEEYFKLPFEKKAGESGVFPPGRSLYPAPYSVWRDRARQILENAGDLNELLHLPPLMVTLGITDVCHLDCEFCFVSPEFSKLFGKYYDKKHPFLMPKETLFQLVEDLSQAGTKAIRYVGEGESPLHPSFLDSIALARARGMRVSLINSGGKVATQFASFATYLDYFRISWNAGTARTYEDVHHSALDQFGRVLKGLYSLSEARKELDDAGPLMSCSFVATEGNFLEFPQLAEIAELVGMDFVILKKDNSWEPTDRQYALYNEMVEKCKSRNWLKDGFIVFEYPRFDREKIKEVPNYEVEFGLGCFVHNAGLRANVSYDVVYSCMQFDGPGTTLGDLEEDRFFDSWSGEARKAGAMRKIVVDKSLPRPRCFWRDTKFWMNYFIDNALRERGK